MKTEFSEVKNCRNERHCPWGRGVPGGLPPPVGLCPRKCVVYTIHFCNGNQDFRNTESTQPNAQTQSTTGTAGMHHMPRQSTTGKARDGTKETGHVVHHARAPQTQSQTTSRWHRKENAVVHVWKGRSLHISSFFRYSHHITLILAQHACHFTFAYIVLHKTRNSSLFLHFSRLFMCCTMCCMCCISLELRINTSVSCATSNVPIF